MSKRLFWSVSNVSFVAVLVAIGLSGVAHAQDATPSASPVANAIVQVTGLVNTPLTLSAADLQAMTAQTAEVDFQAGNGAQHHAYTGVLLADVIAQAGLTVDPNVKNDALRFYLVITANDGYETVISWGEIDPNFGNNPYLLAWEEDGQPLTGTDGPVRLVTPGDVKGGRYVTGVVSIDVRRADATSS